MSAQTTISAEDLAHLTRQAFSRAGFPDNDAETAAEVLVTTDLMGIATHGVHRLDQYLKRVRAGVVNAAPDIAVDDRADGRVTVELVARF
ncbi:MAG: Ldh family oxidoreductase, partial [Rhodospirillaceae bacterium]